MVISPIRVGVIGATPDRGWASAAHLPALKAMPAFEIAAVCTTRQETARRSAELHGARRAYADWVRLVADPEIDLVSICVKVAHHREMALAAIAAGKHVFCEWPLGLDTAEAEAMQKAAERAGVHTLVGLQARSSPALAGVRDLIAAGAIGDVVSATLISSLANWGPRLPAAEAYRTRRESGATGLTVPGGHSLDSLCHCLGPFSELSAIVTTQHRRCEIIDTGEVLDVTAPDQVLISGTMRSGAVVSVHVKAAMANPTGVLFQLNGTEGDIVVASRQPVGPAPVGIQRADLVVALARGRRTEFVPVEIGTRHRMAPESVPDGAPFFTAQLYARLAQAIAGGGAPDPDFAAAVRLHRLLDAVQAASDSGSRQTL